VDGKLKAFASVDGSPLLLPGEESTIEVSPKTGESITLSLDRSMQKKVEEIIEVQKVQSSADSISALVMDARTGKVVAMAGYPDYNPAEYYKIDDAFKFQNANVSEATEVGSIIKIFTVAAGLDSGAINKDSTYNNTNSIQIGVNTVSNAYLGHPGTTSIKEVLQYSLNTGVIYVLQQMGQGGITPKAKGTLYKYFTDRYQFAKFTNIELANEADGLIFPPDHQEGSPIRYSNMTFGQGLTITPIQAAAALSAVINGGTYYQPSIIDSIGKSSIPPKKIAEDIISDQTSSDIRDLMYQASKDAHYTLVRDGYQIGAKTGTSQVSDGQGGYTKEGKRGTCFGFIGSKDADYVVMVKVENPQTEGFAGGQTAAPAFREIADAVIDYFKLEPIQ
jgi:cell division protein FtsI/penicillin-binding protein 2